jgi:hypothetical protein
MGRGHGIYFVDTGNKTCTIGRAFGLSNILFGAFDDKE